MYCLTQFCRLCMNNDKTLISLFNCGSDMMTLLHKLNICIPELICEEETTIDSCICTTCSENLTKVFEFRKLCLSTNITLKNYTTQLKNSYSRNLASNLKVLLYANKQDPSLLHSFEKSGLKKVKNESAVRNNEYCETQNPEEIMDVSIDDLLKYACNVKAENIGENDSNKHYNCANKENEQVKNKNQNLVPDVLNIIRLKTIDQLIAPQHDDDTIEICNNDNRNTRSDNLENMINLNAYAPTSSIDFEESAFESALYNEQNDESSDSTMISGQVEKCRLQNYPDTYQEAITLEEFKYEILRRGGSAIFYFYEANKILNDANRRLLVNITVDIIITKYGSQPSKSIKFQYAELIVNLFPNLKNPASKNGGYEAFCSHNNGGEGYIAWRLRTIRRNIRKSKDITNKTSSPVNGDTVNLDASTSKLTIESLPCVVETVLNKEQNIECFNSSIEIGNSVHQVKKLMNLESFKNEIIRRGGTGIFDFYKSYNILNNANRKSLVNITVDIIMARYGVQPTKNINCHYAELIVKLFPNLKDPTSTSGGYEAFYSHKKGGEGYIAWRLRTVRRNKNAKERNKQRHSVSRPNNHLSTKDDTMDLCKSTSILPSIEEFKNQLLQRGGRDIFDYYETHKILNDKNRRFLVNITVDIILAKYGNQPITSIKCQYAEWIVNFFPNLKNPTSESGGYEAFYSHTNGEGGYIAWRLRTFRRIRCINVRKKKGGNNNQINDELMTPVMEEEILYLQNACAKTDIEIIFEKMKFTFPCRKNKGVSILNQFPRFLDTPGLIEQDFKELYPNHTDFAEEFPKYIQKILHIYQSTENNVQDHIICQNKYASSNTAPVTRFVPKFWDSTTRCMFAILQMLPAPSKGRIKGIRESSRKSEKKLVVFKQTMMSNAECMDNKNEHPYLIAEGMNTSVITQYSICVDKKLIPCGTLNSAKAFQQLFMTHIVFDIDYDPSLSTFWSFIQTFFFKIEDESSQNTAKMIELRTRLLQPS